MAPVAPVVKALAEEHGIDLSTVTGTGKGGAIKKADVEALIGGGSSGPSAKTDGSSKTDAGSKTGSATSSTKTGGTGAKTSSTKTGGAGAKPKAKPPTEFYCPGCGRRYPTNDAPCVGGELGHSPIELADAAELDGDPENLTPAPNTD